ncbi:MAG: hypothetical protein ACLP1Y_09460 [Candidatus Acidiferrales bacterium]
MEARPQLAGMDRFFPLHHPTLRIGIFTGVSLSAVLLAVLFLANRVPQLERFALERNVAAAATGLMLMAIPACRFLKSPVRLFVSGTLGWALLSLCYFSLEIRFPRLENRMGALHLFMLGAVAYGFLAVLGWVVSLFWVAHQQPLVVVRRRSP